MSATAVPVVDLELSAMARQTGVAYLHDVHLDTCVALAVGEQVRVRDEGGQVWDAEVMEREETPRGLGHKYRLSIRPATDAAEETAATTGVSDVEQRNRWRQRAAWLAQLGLTTDDPVPVDAVEEVANAVLTLLNVVRGLELERAEARAWAWAGSHGELDYAWVSVAGNAFKGNPDDLPAWLADARPPDAQGWWPVPLAGKD